MSSRIIHKYQETYILHCREFQDNSLILSCFTKEQGIISILAKGARSSKKNYNCLLQPFLNNSISCVQSKSELFILTEVSENRTQSKQQVLQGKALYCAYYLNEIILRLVPENEAYIHLFDLYKKTLNKLLDTDQIALILRYFELHLLHQLGYTPNFVIDTFSDEEIDEDETYLFDPLSGPYKVKINNDKRFKVSGSTLWNLSDFSIPDSQTLKESKYLLRLILKHYLGSKPLKSREVYQQMYG